MKTSPQPKTCCDRQATAGPESSCLSGQAAHLCEHRFASAGRTIQQDALGLPQEESIEQLRLLDGQDDLVVLHTSHATLLASGGIFARLALRRSPIIKFGGIWSTLSIGP